MSTDPCSIQVLGGFAVNCGTRTVTLPQSAQRLLAWLAVNPRRRPRATATAALWPDLSISRAAAAMRTALWYLRREASLPVMQSAGTVQLDTMVAVDLWQAVLRARMLPVASATMTDLRVQDARLTEPGHGPSPVDAHPGPTPPSPAQEHELLSADAWTTWADDFADDLLPDWPDEWLVLHRERHRQVRLHALEQLCQVLTRAGQTGRAIDIALGAVAADPLRESAQRLLIRAHLAEGNPSEAIRQYRSYAQLLRSQIGVEPSPELSALLPSLGRPGSVSRPNARQPPGSAAQAQASGRDVRRPQLAGATPEPGLCR